MSNIDILGFAGALFCCGLAVIIACNKQRSKVHWAFIAGMVGLAAENLFFALTAEAILPADVVFWQKWRLITASCTSAVWLGFSVTYARWNYSEFLKSWRPLLLAAFVIPIAITALFGSHLIISADQNSA